MDQEEILRKVEKALDAQFEMYSWRDMLKDCDLSPDEREWAIENTSYKLDTPMRGCCSKYVGAQTPSIYKEDNEGNRISITKKGLAEYFDFRYCPECGCKLEE